MALHGEAGCSLNIAPGTAELGAWPNGPWPGEQTRRLTGAVLRIMLPGAAPRAPSYSFSLIPAGFDALFHGVCMSGWCFRGCATSAQVRCEGTHLGEVFLCPSVCTDSTYAREVVSKGTTRPTLLPVFCFRQGGGKAKRLPRSIENNTFLCVWLLSARPETSAGKSTGFRSLRDLPRTTMVARDLLHTGKVHLHPEAPLASSTMTLCYPTEQLFVPTGCLGKSHCIFQQEPPEQVTAMGRNRWLHPA